MRGGRKGDEQAELQRSNCVELAAYFINPMFPGTGQEGGKEEEGRKRGSQDQSRAVCLLCFVGFVCVCALCVCIF